MIGRLPTPAALAAALLTLAAAALAHDAPHARTRTFIVERGAEGLTLYARIPAPLVYAPQIAARAHPGDGVEAPYLVQRRSAGRLIHELDLEAIGNDPEGFAALVARGYGLHAGAGPELVPSAALVRVRAGSALPPFASPEQARAAMAGDTSGALGRLFVGDAYADITLAYDGVDPAGTLTLVAKLTAPLPPDVFVDNHIIDAGPGGTTLREIVGQFQGPLALPAPGAAPTH